jgi:PTH1 family peptidyl-tRNA hydrolase
MKLVVGLGNPGRKYEKTKHNVGFMSLDHYAKSNKLKFKKESKFNGESLKIGDLVLLKPHTFMNNSGLSISSTMKYYDIDIQDVCIIYDDLDLPLGKTRLREKGSAGGHNGIKSIIAHLGTEAFRRVRIGIDKNPLYETKDYVLSSFSKKETQVMKEIFVITDQIIDDFAGNIDFLQIMNKYN